MENLLSSTGHFTEHGELFNTEHGEILFPNKFIEGLSKGIGSGFIFHVKVYQMTMDRKHPIHPDSFIGYLYKNGWKIIHLRRRNTVLHSLSYFVALHRGSFHKIDNEKENIRMYIDCDMFVDHMKNKLSSNELEKEILSKVKYHEVIYEDDLERADSHQETIDRILKFLHLEPRPVYTKHKKINIYPLHNLIINYDEFISTLKENEWDDFID